MVSSVTRPRSSLTGCSSGATGLVASEGRGETWIKGEPSVLLPSHFDFLKHPPPSFTLRSHVHVLLKPTHSDRRGAGGGRPTSHPTPHCLLC